MRDFNPPMDIIIVSECIYNLKYADGLVSSMLALSDAKVI